LNRIIKTDYVFEFIGVFSLFGLFLLDFYFFSFYKK